MQRHRVKTLPVLPPDTSVWVDTPNGQVSGRIVEQMGSPGCTEYMYLWEKYRGTECNFAIAHDVIHKQVTLTQERIHK